MAAGRGVDKARSKRPSAPAWANHRAVDLRQFSGIAEASRRERPSAVSPVSVQSWRIAGACWPPAAEMYSGADSQTSMCPCPDGIPNMPGCR